jgi:asparagine synthase (glutamine-hydrolysing)
MVMRQAMAGILPTEVQWRGGKSNLSPNFERGLLTYEQERLEEILINNSELIENYTDIEALHKAYHRFISGVNKDNDVIEIWKALTLALWFEQTKLSPTSLI